MLPQYSALQIIIAFLAASDVVSANAHRSRPHIKFTGASQTQTHDVVCKYGGDIQYVPSRWEVEWSNKLDDVNQKQSICEEMRTYLDRTTTWMTHLSNDATPNVVDDDVFSYFTRPCMQQSGKTMYSKEFIEPLVGHMRHPKQFCEFNTLTKSSPSHLLSLPSTAGSVFPGRKYLFDAGTKDFNSSLAWLISRYAQQGIAFDEIFAWEAQPTNPAEYWATVSDEIVHKLHFINAPIDGELKSPMNPLETMRRIYKPGDFIVFKLDIDNDPLEDKIMEQISNDDGLIAMISEMYLEKHYTSKESDKFFGKPVTTYPEAVRQLARLRSRGLRIHYWH